MATFTRLLVLVFSAIALVASPISLAHAQDTCYGLSADDCNLLHAGSGSAAYAKLTTVTINSHLTFSGNNAATTIAENVYYSAHDPYLTVTPTSDPTFSSQFDVTISTRDGGPDHGTTHIEARVINGIEYINNRGAQWYSVALDVYRGLVQPSSSPVVDSSALAKAAFQLMDGAGITDIERTMDTVGVDQQLASFRYYFDPLQATYGGNLKPILTLVGVHADSLIDLSTNDLEKMQNQLRKTFQNVHFSITRYIGLQDKLPHGLSMDMSANIAPEDLVGLTATPSPEATPASGDTQGFALYYHFDFMISGIGKKVDVPVPSNAVPLPLPKK